MAKISFTSDEQSLVCTETELAWLAGFIDGEGSIVLSSHKPNPRKRQVSQLWVMRLTVTNSYQESIMLIQSWFGGSVEKRKRAKPHHKQTWKWECSGKRARFVLEKIKPYLIVKKSQCELALKYAETLWISGRGHGRNKLSERVLKIRGELVSKVRALNKRGVDLTNN